MCVLGDSATSKHDPHGVNDTNRSGCSGSLYSRDLFHSDVGALPSCELSTTIRNLLLTTLNSARIAPDIRRIFRPLSLILLNVFAPYGVIQGHNGRSDSRQVRKFLARLVAQLLNFATRRLSDNRLCGNSRPDFNRNEGDY